MLQRLGREFYAREGLLVAREMLGKRLVRVAPQGQRSGRIVEVEAYLGPEDQASHARRGPTPRARIMFGPPGIAYVYLVYGMHHALNAVVDREGQPSAVLIRAVEPLDGIEGRTDGPGRLCKALGIDRSLNGQDLVLGEELWLADDGSPAPEVEASARIGVAYAGAEWASKPWRLAIRGNRFVSKAPAVRRS